MNEEENKNKYVEVFGTIYTDCDCYEAFFNHYKQDCSNILKINEYLCFSCPFRNVANVRGLLPEFFEDSGKHSFEDLKKKIDDCITDKIIDKTNKITKKPIKIL